MTGNGANGSFDEERYPGMNDCIGKPMQIELLISVMEKWISAKPDRRIKECTAAATGPAVQRSEKNQFPLDMDRAIQEFMGKKEILYGVLHEFINKAKIRIDTIHQAVKRFDYGVIMAEAHGIKGGAANLTADKLANLAADLEKAGEAQQPDLSADLADKLTQEFCNLEKYVQQNPDVYARFRYQ
jgi:HPt (histidine-containing phosphotransfer) domain-containing protein